jgi:DNA transposition AAA+ family ATPase
MMSKSTSHHGDSFPIASSETKGSQQSFSVRHRVIEYPAFCEATRKISRLHNRWRTAKIPAGILLTGQSGSGKTTVLQHYMRSFQRYEEMERTVIPVLSVVTPARPTVKSLAEAILEAFDDPIVDRGSAENKTRRIYKYMRECLVEMLFIDEFHHFYDSSRRTDARQVSDWLKNLLSHVQIPVVLTGLPRAAMVIRMNEQLARRFSSAYYLRPFSFDTDEGKKEFRGVLKLIHSRLPLSCPELHEANLARRFYIATNGLIDYVAKILDEAIMLAAQFEIDELNLDLFATAFEESIWRDAPHTLNPFRTDSLLRQLNQIGEPFEYWDDPQKYPGQGAQTSVAEAGRVGGFR